jgi:hypothetical protein
MLRSFNGDLMNTVFRGPDDEGGSDGGNFESGTVSNLDSGLDDGAADPGDGGDQPQEPQKLSVRDEIKKNIREANEEASRKQPKSVKTQRQAAPTAPATAAAPATPVSTTPAPASLSQEAKAEWDKAPKAIQDAFIKREQDMANGVAELKQRYDLIDQAIMPHQDALRQMNATPGEAVNRLFLWFKALAASPVQALPQLVQSMGYDWGKVVAAVSGQQPGQQPQQQQGAQQIPPYVTQLEQKIARLEGNLGQFGNQFQTVQQEMNAQNEAKTRENLTFWSKDKEFFEDVRQDMAKIIQSNLIPLKSGQVDLDTVYERAIHWNPDVRAKVLAKQQQANQQVQQQATDAATTARQGQAIRARKAAISLPSNGTPGAANSQMANRKPGKGLSVRESLKASISELRDQ